METFWGIVLLLVIYFVIPIAIFAATLAWLGGIDRFRPGGRRNTGDNA